MFILFSGTRSGFCPRFTGAGSVGIFPTIVSETESLQMVGKIPTAQQRKFPQLNKENSHSSSSASVNLGQNPDPGTHFTPQLSTKLNTNEVINAYIACIHCMHILIRVEKICIFWSELGNFIFFGLSGNFVRVWGQSWENVRF